MNNIDFNSIIAIPNYYTIIPAPVRYDDRLKSSEKLLYGEILALCDYNNCCFENNNYFAELYGVSKTSISKWIKNLENCGYLQTTLIYKNGTKEIDKRIIKIVSKSLNFHGKQEVQYG